MEDSDYDDEFDFRSQPSNWRVITVIVAVFLAAFMIIVGLVYTAVTAHAHEAPLGWKYPWACCSNMDCQRIDSAKVHETDLGYVVDGSADVAPIGYHDKRVKDSPDGLYHWCAHPAGIDAGHTICLFVPPKGF